MYNNPKFISLLQSLFKGREEVFAIRWEKGKRSGYMPAYYFDPYHYRTYKMNGGSFKDYPHKSYLPLTKKEISKHLNGTQQIGIYPLLKDNTSWFLAADFDGKNWQKEAYLFLAACTENDIPAYLEQSRSGNGAHVWIFFDQPYPAFKSRKVFKEILEYSGAFSRFDKTSSFDRLFPNQDALSGKGLGNLIALPFYKLTFDKGNSCFIDPKSLQPYTGQNQFLKNIKRISIQVLDKLYHTYSGGKKGSHPKINSGKLNISLNRNIHISKTGLTLQLINFLKAELNFANSEFFIRKKSGYNTYKTPRYFKLIKETENEIILPRGFIGRLLRFCNQQKINYYFRDLRKLRKPINFNFRTKLRKHQTPVIKVVSKKDFGVIVAPPGSGKTIMGLKIISDKKQPALVIVHRKFLLEQWQERIETFLEIPKNEIGIIGKGKAKIGKKITVATIQSLSKHLEKIQDCFGLVLMDECHHIPAKSFRQTLSKLTTYYLYGLTATPFRKYNDDKMIFAFLGAVIARVENHEIENLKHPQIIVRNTNFEVPFNSKTDDFETLSKILIHDSERNKLILKDVKRELSKGKRVVIITERKEHIRTLYLFLKQAYEVITLSGNDSDISKQSKRKALNEGKFKYC